MVLGGRIDVALRHDPATEQVVLCVSDTGSGISAVDLPHVFERFYRGDKSRQRGDRDSGSGLGLSICRSIVAAHGGTIEARSVEGAGATFEVRLPEQGSGQGSEAGGQRPGEERAVA